MASCSERNVKTMSMIRKNLLILFFVGSPSAIYAFCGDFELGVAPGFELADWLSKTPILLLIFLSCFAPLIFFAGRFARRLAND